MLKAYQQVVLDECEVIISSLTEMDFFKDYEINDLTFVRKYLCDALTQKYIDGLLGEEDISIFTEDEFDKILKDLATGSILYELKKKGLIDSYEDDDTEEIFFLSEKGKLYLEEMKKSDVVETDKELKDMFNLLFGNDDQSNSNV
jgi:hypothetical protein